MFKLIKLSTFFFLPAVLFFSFSVNFCFAADSILPNPENINCDCSASNSSNDACQLACKKQTGDYSLNDFMLIVLVVSEFILGLVGSLALLAFIAGGLMWLLSAGNAELVTRGKQTIIGAVVGLTIVFTSFMIIQLVYTSLGIDKAAGGKWAVSSWFK